jgi:hypothetical protein
MTAERLASSGFRLAPSARLGPDGIGGGSVAERLARVVRSARRRNEGT